MTKSDTNADLAQAYFAAWNARDADAILAALTPEGTYEDPGTGGPIRGAALRAYVTGLWDAFPDLQFDGAGYGDTGPDSGASQWVMRGTNTGALRGLPPTGRTVALRGADFFTFGAGGISRVTGYFDGGEIPRQLGLNVIVQPPRLGPFAFGSSVAVQSGRTDFPEVFAITSLEARDDDAVAAIQDSARQSLTELLGLEGFLGATTATTGRRLVTVSAWSDAETPRRMVGQGAHGSATRAFMAGDLARSGRTTLWRLERDNGPVLRCDACGRMVRAAGQTACACGADLPPEPAFW